MFHPNPNPSSEMMTALNMIQKFCSSAKKCSCRYPDDNRRKVLFETVNLGNTDNLKDSFYVRESQGYIIRLRI